MEFKARFNQIAELEEEVLIDLRGCTERELQVMQEHLFSMGYGWITSVKKIININSNYDIMHIHEDMTLSLSRGITSITSVKFSDYFEPKKEYKGLHSSAKLGL